ncbi:unnamed protein product [Acanthosepion pharaonis]|uniref:Uncharacterized protein n=1 Tax=Acanthosepion pharaonis TaxID=158019 RepID=A0A812BA94_ACAPH|nr:unnamed protein product [Sepia pharaonis]
MLLTCLSISHAHTHCALLLLPAFSLLISLSFYSVSLSFYSVSLSFYSVSLSFYSVSLSFYSLILLSHFTLSFYSLILLSHFTLSFYSLILLSHFTLSFYSLILLSHFTLSFYSLILLSHFTVTHLMHSSSSPKTFYSSLNFVSFPPPPPLHNFLCSLLQILILPATILSQLPTQHPSFLPLADLVAKSKEFFFK